MWTTNYWFERQQIHDLQVVWIRRSCHFLGGFTADDVEFTHVGNVQFTYVGRPDV